MSWDSTKSGTPFIITMAIIDILQTKDETVHRRIDQVRFYCNWVKAVLVDIYPKGHPDIEIINAQKKAIEAVRADYLLEIDINPYEYERKRLLESRIFDISEKIDEIVNHYGLIDRRTMAEGEAPQRTGVMRNKGGQ